MEKFDEIFNHLATIHESRLKSVRDRRTAGRRNTDRQLVSRLCIASQGKTRPIFYISCVWPNDFQKYVIYGKYCAPGVKLPNYDTFIRPINVVNFVTLTFDIQTLKT